MTSASPSSRAAGHGGRWDGWRHAMLAIAITLPIGLLYAALVMGPRPLDPHDLDWLKGDPLEHYLGWLFFVQTPHWSFPLTWTDRLGYPVGSYLSLVDPALLMTFGLLRGLIPAEGQYLGLFYAVNASLQLYCGYRLTLLLTRGDKVASCLGGLMFLLSPIMTQKAFGHFSGGCHWPILAALTCLLRAREDANPVLWMMPLWGLIAVSAVIHPYLGASVCMLAAIAPLRLIADSRIGWPTGASLLAGCPAALAAALYAIGILSVGGGSAAGGFQDYSFNLLSPFNPLPYPALSPLRFGMFPLQEFEGYAYLGLGMLGLLVALIPTLGREIFGWARGQRVAIILLFASCLIVAVSNRVTIGHHVLFTYPLPGPLLFVANAFRAPARFIWPAYYLLIGLAVAGVARAWPRRWARGLLIAALLLQFCDLAGLRAAIRHFQESPSADPSFMHEWPRTWPGSSAIWHEIGRDHAHLVVLPAWQCAEGNSPGGEPGYAIFGHLAASSGMTINEYRASRYAPDSLAVHCHDIPDAVAQGRLAADSAYILNDFLFLRLSAAGGAPSHRCDRVDGYILCLKRQDGAAPGDGAPVAPLVAGQRIDFSSGGDGARFLSGDWRRAEPWGVWSRTADAELLLAVPAGQAVDLQVTLRALVSADHPVQHIGISTHAAPLGQWALDWDAPRHPIALHIPAERVPASGVLDLILSTDAVTTPRALGYGADDRTLGIGLIALAVAAQTQHKP